MAAFFSLNVKSLSFFIRRDCIDGFTGETTSATHSVIVTDKKLQNYAKLRLMRGDRIFIEGYLNYDSCETSKGNIRMCGNIMAVHIEAIK